MMRIVVFFGLKVYGSVTRRYELNHISTENVQQQITHNLKLLASTIVLMYFSRLIHRTAAENKNDH